MSIGHSPAKVVQIDIKVNKKIILQAYDLSPVVPLNPLDLCKWSIPLEVKRTNQLCKIICLSKWWQSVSRQSKMTTTTTKPWGPNSKMTNSSTTTLWKIKKKQNKQWKLSINYKHKG